MIVLAVGDARHPHVGGNFDDGTDGAFAPDDRRYVFMRHAILKADQQAIRRQHRLDQFAGPFGVIGLDDEKDDVERLLDLGDLAEMEGRNLGVDRPGRQVDRDAVLADGLDMIRPLIDESDIEASQGKVGRNGGPLRARAEKCDPRAALFVPTHVTDSPR